MKTLSYEIVDVFTDRPFTGNPLAVVFGADGLARDQMQALAREFNLSETVFVLPSASATYRARIFTPAQELPFAGHPSVGAAAIAVRAGLAEVGLVTQECGAGILPITVYAESPDSSHWRATLTGGQPSVGAELDPAPLLATAGLSTTDFAGPAPRLAGCGLEFAYLPVVPDAVARSSGQAEAARAYGVSRLSVFSWNPDARTAHARVFAPGDGVTEDPATGSAALGLGVWLVACGLLPPDGITGYTVRQGAEVHRPSTLDCTVTAAGGVAASATVTGHVVPIASGQILVPPFIG